MDHDLLRPDQLRRELDEATPTVGSAGLIIAAAILFILGALYFAPPAGERTNIAAGDAVEAPAAPAPSNP